METIEKTISVKINTRPIKNFIKSEAEKQKFYKQTRKNATFSTDKNGKITWSPMNPREAQSRAYFQSLELRIFYAAYGLLRGKSFSKTENHYSEENHPLNKWDKEIEKSLEKMKQMSQIKEE